MAVFSLEFMKKNIIIVFLSLVLTISLVGNILTYQEEKIKKPNPQVSKYSMREKMMNGL